MITKNMVKPTSHWAKVRDEFERVYDMYSKEQFLDYIATAYIMKEVDLELAEKKGDINEA